MRLIDVRVTAAIELETHSETEIEQILKTAEDIQIAATLPQTFLACLHK